MYLRPAIVNDDAMGSDGEGEASYVYDEALAAEEEESGLVIEEEEEEEA